MNTWLLDAIDPLFFGDGRSIGSGEASGRVLPSPQVVAGLVRTRQGLDGRGAWIGDADRARLIPVEGPFPALLDAGGGVGEWLFPAPADALLLESGLHRLVPLDLSGWGASSNAPAGVAPVGLHVADSSKPMSTNALWRWSEVQAWLEAPAAIAATRANPGVAAPPVETRVHVAIDPATGRAIEGALFGTAGRRMVVNPGPPGTFPRTSAAIGLGLRTPAAVDEGVAPAGGERRMVRWRRVDCPLPPAPEAVLRSAEHGAVRVVLATPGIFAQGWRPGHLFDAPRGSAIVGACIGRPEVVSGWDLAKRRARPTRRCVRAGSVYFVRLGGDAAARRAWAEAAWLTPRSDDDQDRLDGYGSLLLGAWDGLLVPPNSRA